MQKPRLWSTFIKVLMTIVILTSLITSLLTFLFFKQDLIPDNALITRLAFIIFALIVMFTSISITLLAYKHFFNPIEQLISALQKVGAGDFKVHLPEYNTDPEIHNINYNFNKMVTSLDSMEMLQTDFVQNVSHEFKTPLSVIEGYATLLYAAPLSNELHDYTERILESTSQLSSLVSNILNLSNLENQQMVPDKKPFSLDEQIRQAVLSMESLWSKKNLIIDIDLPEISYYGNENLIFQIWANLLSNAIKFTPKGGIIAIKIEEDAESIYIEIHDSGIGMSEEVQARIFDKFYQGEQNRNMEGNGLGLSLVKRILNLCDGTITVKSFPDYGSTFTVELPKIK